MVQQVAGSGSRQHRNAADRPLGEYPGMAPPPKLREPVHPPVAADGKELNHWDVMWWLARGQRGLAVVAWLVSIATQFLLLLGPWVISKIVDDGIRAGNATALWQWGAVLLVTAVVTPLMSIQRHRLMTVYRTVLRAISLRAVSRHISNVGAPFSKRVAGGEMTTAFSTDLDRLGMLFTSFIPGSAAVVGIVAGVVILLIISPWVAAASFVGITVMMLVAKPISGWFFTADVEYRDQQGRFNNFTHDTLTGLRILTGIGGKERYAQILERESLALKDKGMHLAGRLAAMVAAVYLMPSMTFVLVVWVAAMVTLQGQITVGQLLQSATTAGAMMGAMMMANGMFRDIPVGLTAAKRSTSIFNVARETHDVGSRSAPVGPAALVDGQTGFVVPPGLCVGVAAQSPQDAVALMERLARFAPEPKPNQPKPNQSDATQREVVESGGVTWGGHPISEYPLSEVRQRVVLAESQAYFMAGSVQDLLCWGRDYSSEQVAAAVTVAHADDIVSALPDGLAQVLPAGASTVSGGQRQRLRLARAILADPEVLLLVEPTSALDATTESVVAQKVVAHREGKTTVVVSTSPLVLAHCDQVVFLPEQGEAVVGAQGHVEFAESNMQYRSLVLRENATVSLESKEN